MIRLNNLFRLYRLMLIIIFSAILSAVFHEVRFTKHKRKHQVDSTVNIGNSTTSSKNIVTIRTKNRIETQSTKKITRNHIRAIIKHINLSQTVYNIIFNAIHLYTSVIVIQVHSNVFYFSQLLESMKKAKDMYKALVIFSHDYWNEEINELVKSVQFVKYIQIFYPYSLQLYPNMFPGEDFKLCINGSVCKKSNLRNPKASQAKLHWWWLANQVFDNMAITSNYNNEILFLEQGDYVTEDFLYTFKSLQSAKMFHCPYCGVISLAAHKRQTSQYHKLQDTSLVESWDDDMPKTGLAFDRHIWKIIKSRSKDFCHYADSRWHKSVLRNLRLRKWAKNLYVIAIKGPRVFKCDEAIGHDSLVEVQKFIEAISAELYPKNVIIGLRKDKGTNRSSLKPAGDWLDSRDKELCMLFAKQSLWY